MDLQHNLDQTIYQGISSGRASAMIFLIRKGDRKQVLCWVTILIQIRLITSLVGPQILYLCVYYSSFNI